MPPAPLKITAYNDSTANPPVGSAQSAGQYLGTSYPKGMVSFTSATPFNLVEITVGPNNWGTVDFMADNFTVIKAAPAVCHGDLDCDGVVSFGDINPFVSYLSNFSGWQAAHVGGSAANGDINGDGTYPSLGDINSFVSLLSSTTLPIVCPP